VKQDPLIFLPTRIVNYYHLLNGIDIKLLVELYRHYSLTRSPGHTILISTATTAKIINCNPEELKQSIEHLQSLELIWVIGWFHESPDLMRVKLIRMKFLSSDIPDLPTRLTTKERQIFRKKDMTDDEK